MKRKITAIICCAVLAAGMLAGCGRGGGQNRTGADRGKREEGPGGRHHACHVGAGGRL